MALPQEKRYTFADILSREDGQRYELYDGQLVALSAPSNLHQKIVAELTRQLGNCLLGKPCRVYPGAFDVQLFAQEGDAPQDIRTVLQPDVSVVCDPEKRKGHGCKGAPDLVIEILSPLTQRIDRRVKYELYQKAGVPEYWIVDPEQQMVQVHTLEDGWYGSPVAYLATAEVPVGVLEDCRIDLKIVFQ